MKTRPAARSRRGTFVPLLALTITGLLAFVALAVDLGMLTVGRTECQNAADVAALSGARVLSNRTGLASMNDKDLAVTTVKNVVPNNVFLNTGFTTPADLNIKVGKYAYNTTSQRFAPDFANGLGAGESWTAVRVTLNETQPTFFAKVLGVQNLPNGAVATAVHRPRDVAIVLDFSASMRFGSMSMWPSNYAGDNGNTIRGFMNPDPNYPRFGHYQRYDAYSQGANKTVANSDSGTVTDRPNPMRMTTAYVTPTGGDVFAPNNHTVETPGGPPMVFDFRFDPANLANPSNPVAKDAAAPANLRNAFHRWFQKTPTDTPDLSLAFVDQTNNFKYSNFRPTVTSTVDNTSTGATSVERTFNWAGYDPFDTTSTNGPVPAPDTFATQDGWPTASPTVPYAGDVYPRKSGAVAANTSWDPLTTTGAAVNAAEMLGWTPNTATTWPGAVLNRTTYFPATAAGLWGYQPSGTAPTGVTTTYDTGATTAWSNFRDATWERYGYDLDLSGTTSGYVNNRDKNANGGTPVWDPRWDWRITVDAATPFETTTTQVGWQMGGTGTGWQHNMKRITGGDDAPTNPTASDQARLTVPPDSTSTTGTGASTSQSITFRPQLKTPPTGKISSFNGYSMGPGYYGKSFFIWPPDPRFGTVNPNTGATGTFPDVTTPSTTDLAFDTNRVPMCDWRRRFFYPSTGTESDSTNRFNPQNTNIDQTLFSTSTTSDTGSGGTAGVLAASGYRVNYRAVLAWLKSGPQVLPPNLRAGRVMYYTSIPNDCDDLSNADKRFWRDYIDFVLGYRGNGVYRSDCTLAGVEYKPWPEGTNLVVRGTSQYFPYQTNSVTTVRWDTLKPINGTGAGNDNGINPATDKDPRPYTNYANNPTRPRAHFWFGPVTMLDFIGMGPATGGIYRLWWPGICHESQSWQLKAAMQSALEDIRVNHPNDCCGLTFFAGASQTFTTPRVSMGQDWTSLKNSLYYPGPKGSNTNTNIVAKLKANPNDSTEVTPYDTGDLNTSFTTSVSPLAGILPNSFGGTDPNTGFATAFNLLSSSSTVFSSGTGSGANGGTGRRGATKIVIFETDGNPNGFPQWTRNGSGTDNRYDLGSTANTSGNEKWDGATMYPSASAAGFRYPRRLADVTFAGATTDQQNAALMALAIVYRINQPASTTGNSGFSLPNSEARVYPIAFGDLFRGYTVAQAGGTDDLTDSSWANNTSNALAARLGVKFLVAAGQVGGTLPIADPANGYPGITAATLPTANVITGTYQNRINNLRNLLERIMQSGVQVTLIE